jgi:diguanylate cyclase (GGDEF)-like protein
MDSSGILWIGTNGAGIIKLILQNLNFRVFTQIDSDPNSLHMKSLRSLCEDTDGSLLVGGYGGLDRFDRERGGFIRLYSEDVYRILPDSGVPGTMLIGLEGEGLKAFNREKRTWTPFPTPQGVPGVVYVLRKDRKGRIWIGTQGGGFNLWHPETGAFSRFREKDGLPNDVVYGILEDAQGRLWLSTNKGISRFDPELKIFRNFDVNDGLPSNEFNGGAYFKTSAGELTFGGINGFVIFKPDEIQDFSFVPPVVLTDFQIYNKSVPIVQTPDAQSPLRSSITETKELKLSHRDRVFSFEFAALNFIFPEKNQYAYRMEGFDKDWNYVGTRRYAHYTNLSPGRYTFRVKGSNNNGVWNEEGVSVGIRITPPFWRTPWFLSFCGLTVVLATLGVFNLRLRQLTRKKKELEALVAVRTQELKEASLKDPLTGLRNRRFISEVLAGDLQAYISYKTYLLEPRVNRRKVPEDTVFGIFMLDIDHFKTVNDKLGHDAGDQFLVQFAAILKSSVRDDDVIVRFGGEEFLIILKNTDPGYLDRFARKIKDKIEAAAFAISGRALKKTCSIGYIQYPLHLARPKLYDFESTLILVDQGLYHAKKTGRNMAVRILPGQVVPDETRGGPPIQNLDIGFRQGLFSLNEIR